MFSAPQILKKTLARGSPETSLAPLAPASITPEEWQEMVRAECDRVRACQRLCVRQTGPAPDGATDARHSTRSVPTAASGGEAAAGPPFRGMTVVMYSLDQAGALCARSVRASVKGPTRMVGQGWRHGEGMRNGEKRRELAEGLGEVVRAVVGEWE